ncbi:SusC/RagA family TonB-linked outer membrane protein [Aquimarina agarivorans]|uniref:SusC/RagA family TonB-linked outer membrane protein n=1 Tax=Aquimarina agarivorans TaxID=980584 RepID=UPI000248EBA2|nr:SusC/RagA family TonB-linked outer membrane protein [Aquimarina agarivorans]
MLVIQVALAQNRTIAGTVTDDAGLPLPGANVLIENKPGGTVTDFDGKFVIEVSNDDTIVVSYIGYETQSILVGDKSALTFKLIEDTESLQEVVITAQGIKREKKAIGYAITTLDPEEVEDRPEADVARVLNGKVSGVNVVGVGGVAGSGTNIIIRGQSSITQNNQALFVVNGIPFNTATNSQDTDGAFTDGTANTSSRSLDIDPNNIASVSVLKGLAATVLYGEQGRNGVVLITTKDASGSEVGKKMEITLSQSIFASEISGLPDYQNTYGQGGGGVANVGFVGNWGQRFDENITVRNHLRQSQFADIFPELQVNVPYQAFEDNVKDFFRTGLATTTSISARKSSETNSFSASFSHTDEDGFVPNNSLRRTNFSVGGSANLTNNFTISGAFNFARTDFRTPPISANNAVDGVSIFQRTLFIPRNLDLTGLPFQNPTDGSNIYYRTDQENPLWLLENSGFSQISDRFFNSLSTNYSFTDKLSLTYRVGFDTYTERQDYFFNKGGVSSQQSREGYLRTTSGTNTTWDHSLIFNAANINLTDNFHLTAVAGLNTRSEVYEQFGTVSSNQISFGFLNHSNFETQSSNDPLRANGSVDFKERTNIIGLYGQTEFDYNNYLFLTLAARNDWGSTVEEENQSLFYPSVSLAALPTSFIPGLKSEGLNFLKFRFGYGTSAGFPDPYLTRPNLVQTPAAFGSNVTNSISNRLPNPDLKPERHEEIELGMDAKLWKNRIGLDVSVYRRNSTDQIVDRPTDASTGGTVIATNIGKIVNDGIEVGLNFSPFKGTKGVQWDMRNIFTAYETTTEELADGLDEILIDGFAGLGNVARVDAPLGAIIGSFALRDEAGNLVVDSSDGTIIDSADLGLRARIIGDPNPDWKLSTIHTISYKGFSLSAQLEYTHGGDILSNTIGNLLRRGVTKDTEDRERTFVLPGVSGSVVNGELNIARDAAGNALPNTFQLGSNEVYFLNFADANDQLIFDASVLRLREVSLGYSVPKKFLEGTPFGSMSFTAVGQNLFFWAPNVPKYTNFDPETISTGVGNGRGLDFQTAPNARKFGFNFKTTF